MQFLVLKSSWTVSLEWISASMIVRWFAKIRRGNK